MVSAFQIETPKGPVSAERSGPEAGPVLLLAHGAGGDLRSPILVGFAEGLAGRGIACVRFNFPYKEAGRRGPDSERTLREAWTAVFEATDGGPVWVGGKSLGGRIATMQVADGAIEPAGLILVGYPLHPPGKREKIRDAHLPAIGIPMLFLQGTADPFANWDLVEATMAGLGDRAELHAVEGGDHSFRVKGEPRDDEGTGRRLAEVAARFIEEHG